MAGVLSDILDAVHLKAVLYFRAEFHPPFGVAVPEFHRASRFHLVVPRECFVHLGDGTVVTATSGDLAFVLNGLLRLLPHMPRCQRGSFR